MKTPITAGAAIFTVLTTDLLSESDRAMLRAEIAKFPHPSKVREIANELGFAAVATDPRGRCVTLMYKGVEVALLYKRLTQEFEVTKFDTAPSVFLKEPDDAWMLIDLLNVTQDVSADAVSKALSVSDEELRRARACIQQLLATVDAQSAAVAELTLRVEALRDAKREGRKLKDKDPGSITVTPFPEEIVRQMPKAKRTPRSTSVKAAPVKAAKSAKVKKTTKVKSAPAGPDSSVKPKGKWRPVSKGKLKAKTKSKR